MINTAEYKKHIYDVVGAIHEVHKELGPGLNEKVYQEGLQLELTERNNPFKKKALCLRRCCPIPVPKSS